MSRHTLHCLALMRHGDGGVFLPPPKSQSTEGGRDSWDADPLLRSSLSTCSAGRHKIAKSSRGGKDLSQEAAQKRIMSY